MIRDSLEDHGHIEIPNMIGSILFTLNVVSKKKEKKADLQSNENKFR
jgi:hypothetical protein